MRSFLAGRRLAAGVTLCTFSLTTVAWAAPDHATLKAKAAAEGPVKAGLEEALRAGVQHLAQTFFPAAGLEERVLTEQAGPHAGPVVSVAFSPSGGALVSGGPGAVRLWSLANASVHNHPMEGRGPWAVGFARTAQGGMMRSTPLAVGRWNLGLGEQQGSLRESPAPEGRWSDDNPPRVTISGDGDTVGVITMEGFPGGEWYLNVFPRQGGKTQQVPLPIPGENPVALRFDGQEAVVGSGRRIAVFATAEDKATVAGPVMVGDLSTEITSVTLRPDGQTVALGLADGTVALVDRPTVGAQPSARAFGRAQDAITSLAFSPDGATLAAGVADGTIHLWPVPAAGLEESNLTAHLDRLRTLWWSEEELQGLRERWFTTTFEITAEEIERLAASAVFGGPSGTSAGRLVNEIAGMNRALTIVLLEGARRRFLHQEYQTWMKELPTSALVGPVAHALQEVLDQAIETKTPQGIFLPDLMRQMGLDPMDEGQRERAVALVSAYGVESEGTWPNQLLRVTPDVTLVRTAPAAGLEEGRARVDEEPAWQDGLEQVLGLLESPALRGLATAGRDGADHVWGRVETDLRAAQQTQDPAQVHAALTEASRALLGARIPRSSLEILFSAMKKAFPDVPPAGLEESLRVPAGDDDPADAEVGSEKAEAIVRQPESSSFTPNQVKELVKALGRDPLIVFLVVDPAEASPTFLTAAQVPGKLDDLIRRGVGRRFEVRFADQLSELDRTQFVRVPPLTTLSSPVVIRAVPAAGLEEARHALAERLAAFGITVEGGYAGMPSDPATAGWAMHEIRPEERGPIHEALDQMPLVELLYPLEALPLAPGSELGINSEAVKIGLADVDGTPQPVAVKQFKRDTWEHDLRKELVAAQVLGRLGISPRFYGVVRDNQQRIVAYAMQVVDGEPIVGDMVVHEDPEGFLEIMNRAMRAGLGSAPSFLRTRRGHPVAIDAGNIWIFSEDKYQQFINELNRPAGLEEAREAFLKAQNELVRAETADGTGWRPAGVAILGDAALQEHDEFWRVLDHVHPTIGLQILFHLSPGFAQSHADQLERLGDQRNVYAFTDPRDLVSHARHFLGARQAVYYAAPGDEQVSDLLAAAGDQLEVRPVPYQSLLQFFQQLMAFVRANVPVEQLSADDQAVAEKLARLAENL